MFQPQLVAAIDRLKAGHLSSNFKQLASLRDIQTLCEFLIPAVRLPENHIESKDDNYYETIMQTIMQTNVKTKLQPTIKTIMEHTMKLIMQNYVESYNET